MNIPGLPDTMLAQQTWSNAQLEQLSLLMAAASQISGSSLPLALPGMPPSNITLADMNQSSSAFTSSHLLPIQSVDVNSSGGSVLSAHNMNCFIPDGKTVVRYPEPDLKSLVYDPAVGYRFDPSTGLHYDANSGLFINKKQEILLKYDKLNNTYERAGSTADITAPVLAKEFAELMGYVTAQSAMTDRSPVSPRASPFPPTISSDSRPVAIPGEWKRSPSYDEMSSGPRSPDCQKHSPSSPQIDVELKPMYNERYTPSPSTDFKQSPIPVRGGSRSTRDNSLSPRSGRVPRTSSSPDSSANQRWDDHSKKGRHLLCQLLTLVF